MRQQHHIDEFIVRVLFGNFYNFIRLDRHPDLRRQNHRRHRVHI